MVTIVHEVCYQKATEKFIPQIVTMHKAYIADEGLNEFLNLYLEYYYQKILEAGDYVIIALVDDKVIGFCTLVTDQRNILLDLMKHKYREIFKFPINTWTPIAAYIISKILHEVFGGKWGNSEVGQYRSCIELRAIATDPDHRRAHIGSNLLQYCVGLARQAKKLPIIAWVKEDNEKSINLFEKNGFHIAGVREDKAEKVFLFLLSA